MAEDVIARYVLDLNTLKGQVQELEKTFNKAEGAASTSAKKVSASFNQAATSAKSSLQGIGESIIAAFAVREVINFAKEAVNAFAKAESQVNQLKFAITKIGGESDAAFGKLITQAKELASITFFDDEDIAQAQALQAQFGLNSDQIQKLTPLILELSVATGQDLPAATQTALQAITGQTRGLKVVGAAFKDTGSLTENFNVLTEKLSKLQGTAAQALDTTAGAIRRNAVEVENANEKIGEKLAPALVKLNSLFLDLKDALASFVVDFADFVGGSDAPKKFDDLAKAAKASNDVLVESFKKQFEGLDPKSISDKLDFVTEKFNDYKSDLQKIDDQIAANNLKAANLPIDTNRKANLDAIKKENDELRIQRSVVAEAQKQYSSQVIALIQLSRQGGTVTKQQATDIESLTKLSIEQLKALQDQLENNGNNGIANQDALKNIDDVGEKVAASIVEFFSHPDTRLLISQLALAGVNLENTQKSETNLGALQGKTFLFTGTMNMKRSDAEALVESKGGKLLSGVSSKLNYLVVGEDAGSKLDKAKKLGSVHILSEEEFLVFVNSELQ